MNVVAASKTKLFSFDEKFSSVDDDERIFINSNNNVSETALIVGFGDVKYFRTQFQKTFGMTPSNYIKKYRKPFQDSYSL